MEKPISISIKNVKPTSLKKLRLMAVEAGLRLGQMFDRIMERAKGTRAPKGSGPKRGKKDSTKAA